ncbi:3-oxoadipate enol-lactonase [Saccharopolyspora gloriosae]|uniref:3-oxoadipate enol-lactonase n=1 Tax=Saccharopolyspora gloriosae TaxID=455344 RepID=A0A840NTD8_9PSEU|nr:3-oxoadipate enol-lactonase [Saccharopolyspora gloriosae]
MTTWEELGLNRLVDGDRDAPVLVLSNALGGTAEMWRPQLAALTEHYLVVRYDQRGHGGSPVLPGPYSVQDLAGDVLALLDHLEVSSASFAGASLGGVIGLWLGAHAPERIDALTVCGTSAWLDRRDAELDRARAARENGTNELVAPTVERWFTPYFRERHAEEVASYAAMIAGTDDEAYAWCCEVLAHADLRGALSSISAPTLVISGAEDPATPPEHGAAIADGIGGNARLEVVDHAAHLANVERAAEVNALLLADRSTWSR